MINSGKMLSGIVFVISGSVAVPVISSHSSKSESLISKPTKEEFVGLLGNYDVLLTGADANNGIVTKLSLHQEKGGKKTGKVDKVTGRGVQGQNNGTLYYDDKARVYTFTDKSGTNRSAPCYGSGYGWKGNVACLAWGRVASGYENIGKEKFLKIKLNDGGTAKRPEGMYYGGAMPDSLRFCNRAIVTEKNNNNLEVSIGCQNLTIHKTITNPSKILNSKSQ